MEKEIINKYKNKIILLLIIIYVTVALCITGYYYIDNIFMHYEYSDEIWEYVKLFIFLNVPAITLSIVYLISTKFKHSENIQTFFVILSVIIAYVFIPYIFICCFFVDFGRRTAYPPKLGYKYSLNKFSKNRDKKLFDFFPDKISDKTFRHIYCSFSDIYYLELYADNNYFSEIKNKYKNEISETVNVKNMEDNYKYQDVRILTVSNKDDLTFYFLKKKDNNTDYTSGFAISEADNIIVFFYCDNDIKIKQQSEIALK